MKRLTILGTALAASGLCASVSGAESLYSFYLNYNAYQIELREYDPLTGQLLGTTPFINTGGMASPLGFAWHDNRFVTIIQNQIGHRGLVEIHPASGVGALIGWSGMQMFNPIPEANPLTGDLLYLNYETFNSARLYQVDPLTGAVTPGAHLNGATGVLNAFCIDASGAAIGSLNLDLYTLDVSTGFTTLLGPIQVPNPAYAFYDLACSSTGTVVGMLSQGAPYATTGVYRIDPQALTATPLILMPGHAVPAIGVAFAPDRSGTAYCQSKLGSLGCLPSISAHGFPSVTADFGYEIACDNVRNQTPGVLFFGLGGTANIPFQGGTLCIAGPVRRTTAVNSLGSPPGLADCTGCWSIDFNAYLWNRQITPGSMVPGTTIYVQWYGRDQGLPSPVNSTLSNALQFTMLR